MVVTADRQARRLAMIDFPTPVAAVTRLKVPKSFNGRNPQMRRDLASALRDKTHGLMPPPPRPGGRAARRSGAPRRPVDDEIETLRARLKAHPCHGCPDREDHARWAERCFKLDRDAATLRRRIEQRTNTVARQFDRVCEVLTALGYLDGDEVTDRGRHLMRLYGETDLLAAEALRLGLWDGLTPVGPGRGAVGAGLRDPPRRRQPRAPHPRRRHRRGHRGHPAAVGRPRRARARAQARLPAPARPGFAWLAYRWAEGDDLDDLLGASDLSAGDFVRWTKQLLDLAGQVADAAGDSPLRRTAREVTRPASSAASWPTRASPRTDGGSCGQARRRSGAIRPAGRRPTTRRGPRWPTGRRR